VQLARYAITLDQAVDRFFKQNIEVVTRPSDRPHTEVLDEVRKKLASIPGLDSEVGQPISHRIDHLLSGTRAQIAIKVSGPDLVTLRAKAEEVRAAMKDVPGVVDLFVEPQVGVPQLQINLNRQAAAAVGLKASDLAETNV
jgi:Cu/Ag efflux pump CusA